MDGCDYLEDIYGIGMSGCDCLKHIYGYACLFKVVSWVGVGGGDC